MFPMQSNSRLHWITPTTISGGYGRAEFRIGPSEEAMYETGTNIVLPKEAKTANLNVSVFQAPFPLSRSHLAKKEASELTCHELINDDSNPHICLRQNEDFVLTYRPYQNNVDVEPQYEINVLPMPHVRFGYLEIFIRGLYDA